MDREKTITIISWSVVLIWMIFIFCLSSQVREQSNALSMDVTEMLIRTVEKVAPKSALSVSDLNHIVRKNAHFFAYLVLGLLVSNAMRRSGFAKMQWTLLICVLYAMSDEWHQMFVPGRGPQVKDVLIDSAGALLGIALYFVYSLHKFKLTNRMENNK